jgi:hypothetical protein
LVAIAFSGTAVAQQFPAFEDVDTSGDGAIDRTEAKSVPALEFDSADTDQDGVLSLQEYAVAAIGPAAPILPLQ